MQEENDQESLQDEEVKARHRENIKKTFKQEVEGYVLVKVTRMDSKCGKVKLMQY